MSFLSPQVQEWLAFSVVGLVALRILWGFFKNAVVAPLSQFLLKKGWIKWAMRVRSVGCKNGCG